VLHFPWSEEGRHRRKSKAESIRDVEKAD
jgi:hypothetical protein